MITIKHLKTELDKFPDDAQAYAYEGEITGIVIVKNGHQLGYITAVPTEGHETTVVEEI